MGFPTKTDEQYPVIVEELLKAFDKKAQSFVTAWRILRVPSVTDQIFIKAQRARTIQQAKEDDARHKIESELMGIANYSAMALIQIDLGAASTPDITAKEANELVRGQFDKAKSLMFNKNHDYGEAWRQMRISSLVDLILMKLLRVKQIENHDGQTLVSEGVGANYQDMINYAIFALIHIREEKLDPIN